MSNQPPHVPKFGDWDVDGEHNEQQAYTLIFTNVRAEKGMNRVNPNDPAFLTEYISSSASSSSSSSSSSQAVVHDLYSSPPLPSLQESPPPPLNPTSNQKNQIPHVPKFGEWDVDGKNRGEQAFTLIFDNMRADKSMKKVNPNDPAFLADFIKSSSSSPASPQAAVHGVSRPSSSPLRHESPQPPIKPTTSKVSMHHKQVVAPKFGHWDVEHPKEYTAIFDGLKHEKRQRHASTHHESQTTNTSPTTRQRHASTHHEPQTTNTSPTTRQRHASTHHEPQTTNTSPTTPLPTHKPFLMSWRQCFNGGQDVRE